MFLLFLIENIADLKLHTSEVNLGDHYLDILPYLFIGHEGTEMIPSFLFPIFLTPPTQLQITVVHCLKDYVVHGH
jgi:hypothetical protein